MIDGHPSGGKAPTAPDRLEIAYFVVQIGR